MLKKEAERITGGLSAPGKMPEGSYNLSASMCQTGQKLAKVPDTPCYKCYAFKGRFNFPNVKDALARRLKSLTHPRWVEAMTVLVKGKKHFRWHDSGDLQGVAHLKKIFEVCNNTPGTMHWLPTQERRYLPLGSYPDNLTIRLSNAKNNTHLVRPGLIGPRSWIMMRQSMALQSNIAPRQNRATNAAAVGTAGLET